MGQFTNFNFANPVTSGFTINVSYTLALLSHIDERPTVGITSARHGADSGDSDCHEKQTIIPEA